MSNKQLFSSLNNATGSIVDSEGYMRISMNSGGGSGGTNGWVSQWFKGP
jgi:hypothetical protein